MIDKLAEINRVLLAASDLMDEQNTVSMDAVIHHCQGTVIQGRMPNHENTIEYAATLGFLRRDGKTIRITAEGKDFLSLNSEGMYELSEEQTWLLIRSFYFHGPMREETHRVLSGFAIAHEKSTFRWSSIDSPPLEGKEWVLRHLTELGLLIRGDTWFEVNNEYVDATAAFLSEGKGFTEEQFLRYLREKKEVGDLAESFVLDFEKKRLREKGCELEAMGVRSISRLRVNAGYDIESFNGKTTNLHYNRLIEVKGAKSAKVRFFWSDNEIRVAREHGNRYWIYFQGGIDPKTGTAKNRPILFRNPVDTILDVGVSNGTFEATAQGVIVEGNMRGELIEVR